MDVPPLQPGTSCVVAELLPHRHEMLLADAVNYGADYGQIMLTIRPYRFLCYGVQVGPAWGGI